MESIAAPLRALAEEASWFARANEVRLLHVVTDTDLRDAVLKVLMGQEFHAANRSAFARLDDAFTSATPGWTERSARLRAQHEARVAAMTEGHGPPLPPAPTSREPATAFALQARQVADAAPPPTKGLVVVLAPTRVEDPLEWAVAVRGLVLSPSLADVRWIVVDLDRSTLGALATDLRTGAMEVTTLVDEAALDRDLASALDAAAAAPVGAPGPALMGAAWPRGVTPPPRPNQITLSPAELKAAMIAAGISPAITPDESQGLRTLILRAAQALKAKRGPEAVRLQREARDRCDALQLPALAVTMELVLGTYLIQLAQTKLAVETLQAASERALKADMPKEAAQAQLALGALMGVERRADKAALAFTQAGELSLRAGIPLLAIEAYRLAGTQCADVGLKTQLWKRALDAAGELEPDAQKASSAAETARALAALLRKNGLHAQASEMERQSVALEAGASPKASVA